MDPITKDFNPKMLEILLTFTGFHDPYFKGLIDKEEQPGPILSLMTVHSFDHLFLFDTPTTNKITENTKKAVSRLYPKTKVDTLNIKLDDPTDYREILRGLRQHIKAIQQNFTKAHFFISVASGTPQMHACWFLLTAAGEIPATILHVRPPNFVTKQHPLVSKVDLTAPDFPQVRFQIHQRSDPDKIQVDMESVAQRFGLVGDHPSIREALEKATLLASSTAPILLYGETGTGKELFSRFIHRMSSRSEKNFVPVNCAALPESLVESLLFGHKKGAFTGALTDQIGKFDLAHKGTLFLDELGDLPLPIQAKLLRVLQDGWVEPIGVSKPHLLDVRIIGATNRDLRKQVRQGKFREDLYYRINVGEISLPPLRKRRTDIPKLSLTILDRLNASLRNPKRISPEALIWLQTHNWPGNVRDLENTIERSIRLCRSDVLNPSDLLISEPVTYADPLDALPEPCEGFSLEEFLNNARKQIMLKAVETSVGNKSRAARLLGVSPQAVHKFFKQTKTDN